jgi:ABC-type antimicrobial peptide transport system permease subunit
VLSNSVERRRREIGIRVALGAQPAAVFAMIVRQGMSIATLGATAGLIAARLLPAPGAQSWGATAGAAILTLAASLIACAVPAIRALAVDPAIVLRQH